MNLHPPQRTISLPPRRLSHDSFFSRFLCGGSSILSYRRSNQQILTKKTLLTSGCRVIEYFFFCASVCTIRCVNPLTSCRRGLNDLRPPLRARRRASSRGSQSPHRQPPRRYTSRCAMRRSSVCCNSCPGGIACTRHTHAGSCCTLHHRPWRGNIWMRNISSFRPTPRATSCCASKTGCSDTFRCP